LESFPTKKLLARLKQLHECEEALALSDRDAPDASAGIEFKQDAAWIAAYRDIKQVLATREHVPRRSERP